MPDVPRGPEYAVADPKMRFRVWRDGMVPGSVSLEVLRQLSVSAETGLGARIDAEASARQTADNSEAAARIYADMQEGQARIAADNQERSERQAADSAEAKTRADADTALSQRAAYLEAAAIADERAIAALQTGASAEAKARTEADTAETAARIAGDKALQDQVTALKNTIVPFLGAVMTLPAGLSILTGKSTRTITVTGLKKNDNLVVTPNATLPANISMGEAYCATDGVLTVVLINSATLGLSITTAQTIPLGVIALRP